MDELSAAVDKLKAAGIEPVSVGAGDKWPAAHYWYYLALRECPEQVLQDAVKSLDFSDQCFVKAGEDLQKVIATKPFNKGFLSTPAQTGPTSASGLLATGKVAMEMQGHWEPGVMQGLTEDKKGLGENTGWFPFPSVAGGQGDQSAALGGGDAWAVLEGRARRRRRLRQVPAVRRGPEGLRRARHGAADQPGRDAARSRTRPSVACSRSATRPRTSSCTSTPPSGQSVGGAMNDEIALMFAGKATPQDIVDKTQQAADAEK